jgi:hypothetical protein
MSNSTVKFLHLRNVDDREMGTSSLYGGKTIAYKLEGDLMKYVVALCGKKEHFNRKLGNKIAGGRLQCERKACQKKYVHTVDLTSYDMPPIEALIELEG